MLIFFSGSIGDTLICLPFLRELRRRNPGETIALLHDDAQTGCRELLENSGYIDVFLTYHAESGPAGKIRLFFRLFRLLRPYRFRKLVYLLRTQRGLSFRLRRDMAFFGLLGIREFVGIHRLFELPEPSENGALPMVPHHYDLLAERLKADGIIPMADSDAVFPLSFTPEEQEKAAGWSRRLRKAAGHRRPIAVGIGGNKAVCRWPLEYYAEVLRSLIAEDNIFPVFFGGKADGERIASMCSELLCGASASSFGSLSLRECVGAMRSCAWYLGNDTGTLHMAVAAELKCVAVYSAHNYRGLWYPYGDGHRVLRSSVPCEVCFRQECGFGNPPPCLLDIKPAAVLKECRALNGEIR